MKRCLLVLVAALGVLVLSQQEGIAAPRHADHPAGVVRNEGNARRAHNAAARKSAGEERSATITVESGDTLWSIAADNLAADRNVRQVSRYWLRIYRANRAVIGRNPNLIYPGQVLALPSLGKGPVLTARDIETGEGRAKGRVSGSNKGEGKARGTDAKADAKAGNSPESVTETSNSVQGLQKIDEPPPATVHFVARDALFGFPVDATVSIVSPTGYVQHHDLGANGQETLQLPASGNYVARLGGAGLSPAVHFAAPQSSSVSLALFSYIDALGLLAALAALALVMLFATRRREKNVLLGATPVKDSVEQAPSLQHAPSHSNPGAVRSPRWATGPKTGPSHKGKSYVRLHLKRGRVVEGWIAKPWRPWEGSETSIEVSAEYDENAAPEAVDAYPLSPRREFVAWADVRAADVCGAGDWTIQIRWEGDCCVVACTGTMGAEGDSALREAVEGCLTANHTYLRIDSSGVKHVDGSVNAETESGTSSLQEPSTALNGQPYLLPHGSSSARAGEPIHAATKVAADEDRAPEGDPYAGTRTAASSETASYVADVLTDAARDVARFVHERERRGEPIDSTLVEAIAAGQESLRGFLRSRPEAEPPPVDDANGKAAEASPGRSGDAPQNGRPVNGGDLPIDAVLADLPGSEPEGRVEGLLRRRRGRAG